MRAGKYLFVVYSSGFSYRKCATNLQSLSDELAPKVSSSWTNTSLSSESKGLGLCIRPQCPMTNHLLN